MRIVGGAFRGRPIASPEGSATRPTADRVRENMFNILVHGAPGLDLDGARVIDLFAGTGALGLEALSRGAAFTLFVEEDASARAAIRENVEAMGLTGRSRIFRRDATALGPVGTMAPFALAFLDPPYGRQLADRALAALADGGWLSPGAIAVVEERKDAVLALPAGFTALDQRTYGDTAVIMLAWSGAD
jgi:16S rRNA (guanine966-N2)-methyltransferase